MNYYKVGSKYFEEGSGKELGQNDLSGGKYLGVKFSDIKNRDEQGNYLNTKNAPGYQYVSEDLLNNPKSGWTEQDLSNKGFVIGEYKIPELKNVNSGIVSNTSGITEKAGDLSAYGSSIKESLGETDWNKYIDDLRSRLDKLNNFSLDEEDRIKAAGVAAGLKYDPMIREAEEAKRGGMAKTNVAAGRMGGFMNTQFAGVAAVSPTNAGKWEGAGGSLEAFKSAYDRNINNLQDQKLQAIALAEQAEREFIRTGNSNAYEAAIKLYNTAQDAHNQVLTRQNEYQNMMINASTEARTQKTYLATQATNQLSLLSQAGTNWNAVSDADKNLLAEQLGIPVQSLQGLYQDMQLATEFKKQGRYADFTAKITNILAQIPAGTKITIGGKEYEGTGDGTGTGSDYTGYSTDMKEYEYAVSRGEFTGSFADWKASGGSSGGKSPYQAERATRTLASIDELEKQVDNSTTGFGALVNWVPTSESRYFKSQLDTLKSAIAFGELTAMREASKTGGALGSVSDKEMRLLENALGALDQGMSPTQFKAQLKKIKDSINRWQEEANKSNYSSSSISSPSDVDWAF